MHIENISCMLRYKLFEMFPGCDNVQLSERSWYFAVGIGHDHHNVRVTREHVDICRKVRVSHFHPLKLRLRLRATYFELLDDVGNPFKTMAIVVVRTMEMGQQN